MARPGTRPTSNKTNYQSQPSIPASQKQGAEEQNYINDKINNSGLNEAWSSVVLFDDTYYPDPYTMTGPIEYTINGTNAGNGNKRKDTITGDGNTITFTGFVIRDSTLVPASNVVTTVATKVYTIVFERVGATSEVYLWENNATSTGGGTAETTTYEDSGLTSGNLVADKTNVQEAEAETRAFINSPYKALGTFTGDMTFDSQGQYTDYTLTGDLELTAIGIVVFNMQVVRISTPGGYNVTFGAGIDKLITPFENPLPAGDYWFYMASFVSPGGAGNGIHVNIPEIDEAPPIPEVSWTTFNGTTNWLDFGDILDAETNPDASVIVFECESRNVTGRGRLWAKSTGPSQISYENFFSTLDDKIHQLVDSSGDASVKRLFGSTNPVDWAGEHTWRWVKTGDVVTLYVDGILTGVSEESSVGSWTGGLFNSTARLGFGAQLNDAGAGIAPSAGEFRNLKMIINGTTYIDVPDCSTGIDVSGQGNNGTFNT